jgi:hypothetical protein
MDSNSEQTRSRKEELRAKNDPKYLDVSGRMDAAYAKIIATRMRIILILLDLKKEAAALREEYQSLKKQETDYLESV